MRYAFNAINSQMHFGLTQWLVVLCLALEIGAQLGKDTIGASIATEQQSQAVGSQSDYRQFQPG